MDMIFYATTTRHKRPVRMRCTQLIDSCCMLYFIRSELRTLQTSDTHLHPILTANCVSMRPPQPATRDCMSSKKNRFYLYTRVKRNQVQFIYTYSKKLGPIQMHVFKEIKGPGWLIELGSWISQQLIQAYRCSIRVFRLLSPLNLVAMIQLKYC